MRRIKRDRMELLEQIRSVARGIGADPNWPAGAPTQAEVQALADELDAAITALIAVENEMDGARFRIHTSVDACQSMVRRADNILSGLYGEDGHQKVLFGLRPVDLTRNSPGPTPKVASLKLTDGKAAGSIMADWKRVPRAVYELQWFLDAALEQLAGSAVSTRSELLIQDLTPGTQIWVRVRAHRSKKHGAWSDAATRIANV